MNKDEMTLDQIQQARSNTTGLTNAVGALVKSIFGEEFETTLIIATREKISRIGIMSTLDDREILTAVLNEAVTRIAENRSEDFTERDFITGNSH